MDYLRATLIAQCFIVAAANSTTALAAPLPDGKGAQQAKRFYVEGTVVQYVKENIETGYVEHEYVLRGGDEHTYTLNNARAHKLRGGDRAELAGQLVEGEFFINDVVSVQHVNAKAARAKAATAANETQIRRVAVFLTNLQDVDPLPSSARRDFRESMYTDTYAGFWGTSPVSPAHVVGNHLASSYGQLTFDGDAENDGGYDIFGPFDIALDASPCDYRSWGDAVDAAATNAGIDLSLYQNRIYAVSVRVSCEWSGIAIVNCGDDCRAWSRTASQDTLAHELGHNLGLGHSTRDINGDGDSSDLVDGFSEEYGDRQTMMGGRTEPGNQMNAPHRDMLGYFDDVPGSLLLNPPEGVYPLNSLGTLGDFSQAIKFELGGARSVYAAYRNRDPDEAFFAPASTIEDSVRVHDCATFDCARSYLLAQLSTGESYTHPPSGLTIKALTLLGTPTALVDVKFTCVPFPYVASTSTSDHAVFPGEGEISLTVEIQNNDGIGCPDDAFSVTGTIFGIPNYSASAIIPGQQEEQIQFTVPVPNRRDGHYTHTFQVMQGQTGRIVTVTAATVLDSIPPTTPQNVTVTFPRFPADLSWSPSTDPGDEPSGIARYNVYRDGELTGSPRNPILTIYLGGSYEVEAVDQAGNLSERTKPIVITATR